MVVKTDHGKYKFRFTQGALTELGLFQITVNLPPRPSSSAAPGSRRASLRLLWVWSRTPSSCPAPPPSSPAPPASLARWILRPKWSPRPLSRDNLMLASINWPLKAAYHRLTSLPTFKSYLYTKAVLGFYVGLEFQPLVGEVVVEEKDFGGPCHVMKQFLRPIVLVDPGGENRESSCD